MAAGLKLTGVSTPETVQPSAQVDYAKGVHYLNDDAHLADLGTTKPEFSQRCGIGIIINRHRQSNRCS